MPFPPTVRRWILIFHIAVSVGWLGAVVAYIPLDVAAATSEDATTLRAVYFAMYIVAMRAIVPLAFSTLASGIVVSLGSKWGLFRHYWVLFSLVLTLLAVVVLLVETRVIAHSADTAMDPGATDDQLRALGHTLPHSIGGLVVLLVVLVLNVVKPRGLTPYGLRKQREQLIPRPG